MVGLIIYDMSNIRCQNVSIPIVLKICCVESILHCMCCVFLMFLILSSVRCVDRPTEVQLGIYINSFFSISEQTMVCLMTIDTQYRPAQISDFPKLYSIQSCHLYV